MLVLGGAADMASAAFRNEHAADRRRPTPCAAGSRASSSWSSPAGRGSPTWCTARPRPLVGTAAAAAGGGVLVVVGTVVAALAVPAFVRYRISRAVREAA